MRIAIQLRAMALAFEVTKGLATNRAFKLSQPDDLEQKKIDNSLEIIAIISSEFFFPALKIIHRVHEDWTVHDI